MGIFARIAGWFAQICLPLIMDWLYRKTVGLYMEWSAKRAAEKAIRAKNAQARVVTEAARTPEEREHAASETRRNF